MPRGYIVLHDGTFLNSQVLNEEFTIKTAFADITVTTANIAHILMQKGLPHVLTTRSLDTLKGNVQDTNCTVLLSDNQSRTIPMTQVLSIQFIGI